MTFWHLPPLAFIENTKWWILKENLIHKVESNGKALSIRLHKNDCYIKCPNSGRD